MKKLLLLVAFVGFSTVSFGQPKIEFKAIDNTIDYGTVTKESDSGMRTFEFKNTGNQALIISNVQSTCGCTVPLFPKEPILPGKTGKIDVQYNMAPGPIRKTITVESNASNFESGKVPLKIKGTVIVKQEVNPLEKTKSIMEKS